jgi:hypothetical protein
VKSETPPGQGFGAAALKAAKLYKVEAEDHSDIPDRDVDVEVDFPKA